MIDRIFGNLVNPVHPVKKAPAIFRFTRSRFVLALCTNNSSPLEPKPLSTHDDEQVQLFSRLLVANRRRLYGFILTLVTDRAAVEDILQDVSSLLWQKFDKFEPGTDFAAWGMAVSRLTILNWRRRQKKVPLPLDDQQFALLADEAVAVSCQHESRQAALHDCLQNVNAAGRELLSSRCEMSQTVSLIAE